MMELLTDKYASVVITTFIVNLFSRVTLVLTNRKTNNKRDGDIIATLSEKLDELDKKSVRNELDVKRLELQTAIDRNYGKHAVSKIFDEYTELGGNSYMHDRYEKYMRGDLSDE